MNESRHSLFYLRAKGHNFLWHVYRTDVDNNPHPTPIGGRK